MKIGILTFHCAHNYGAVLQCYALQTFLESLGHEVFVIDYRPRYLVKRYALFSRKHWIAKSVKRTIARFLTEPYLLFIRKIRSHRLEEFVSSKLHLFPYSNNSDYSDFDAIVLGSDQIWNPKLTGMGFDEVYFGKGFSCRKIAYAASNRSISISKTEERFYIEHLKELTYLGVRESSLQSLLQPLTDKEVILTIDPTLLSDRRWTLGLQQIRPISKDYVMLYEVSRHSENRFLVRSYAKRNSFSFVELTGALSLSCRDAFHLDQTASPEKFLSYIYFATCVFTTSFHGVALSILLGKDFFYLKQHTDADIRIESLLDVLKIKNRMIESNEVPETMPIDYSDVQKRLESFRLSSVQYLLDALNC